MAIQYYKIGSTGEHYQLDKDTGQASKIAAPPAGGSVITWGGAGLPSELQNALSAAPQTPATPTAPVAPTASPTTPYSSTPVPSPYTTPTATPAPTPVAQKPALPDTVYDFYKGLLKAGQLTPEQAAANIGGLVSGGQYAGSFDPSKLYTPGFSYKGPNGESLSFDTTGTGKSIKDSTTVQQTMVTPSGMSTATHEVAPGMPPVPTTGTALQTPEQLAMAERAKSIPGLNLSAIMPNTGTPIIPSGNVNAGTTQNGAGTPVVPTTTPPTNTTAPTSIFGANGEVTDPSMTGDTLLKKLFELMTPSTAENDVSMQLANTEASRRLSYQDIEKNPIATPFQTGQEAAVDKSINTTQQNLQGKLAVLQSKRIAALDATKAALDYTKPVALGMGTNLVVPGGSNAGTVVAEGQSYTAKQGAANVLSLSKTYPDAGIVPSDTPDIAAQKAAAAPSFIAKFGKVNVQWNPSTGQFEVQATNRLGNTTPGNVVIPSGSGANTSPSTNFGTSGGGGATLQPGASGSQVSQLQQWLISNGYNIPDGATGYYGSQTAAAVAAFQQATGVDTSGGGSGVFGPKTSSAASSKGFSLAGTLGGGSTGAPTSLVTTSSSPFGLNTSNKIDNATLTYLQTGEFPDGLYPADKNSVAARARQINPNFNPAVAKANTSAITDQTKQLANITAAMGAAESNFKLLVDGASKAGVNASTVGIINSIDRAVKQGLMSDADVAKFNSTLQTVKTEFAQVLARGGEVTDSVRKEANSVVDGNLSTGTLTQLYSRLQEEAKNVIKARQDEIIRLSGGGGIGSSKLDSGASTGVTPGGVSYTIH